MRHVTSKQIPAKIEEVKAEFLEWAKEHRTYLYANPLTPCIFVQQVSATHYHVGWRFTNAKTQIGKVQQDCHMAYNPDQTIAWVYEGASAQ